MPGNLNRESWANPKKKNVQRKDARKNPPFYTPENEHDIGKSPFLIGDISSFIVDFPFSFVTVWGVWPPCSLNF